jgi:hypothetical protein
MSQISTTKFVSGDGIEHEVETGSPAYDQMVKSGFTRVESKEESTQVSRMLGAGPSDETTEGGAAGSPAPDENAEKPPVDLSKMTKAQLVAYAEELGVAVTPDTMTKAAIVEAIEGTAVERSPQVDG